MSAREEILARVRTALDDRHPAAGEATAVAADAAPPGAAASGAGRSAAPGGASAATQEQLVERFAERAGEYRATVCRVSAPALAATLADVCAEHRIRRLAIPAGLPDAWAPPGVETVRDETLAPHELDAIDGVLTGCALAIAETGTLVLDGGPRCGRRALTLVPDLHVCVVETAQVVAGLDEAFATLTAARPLTLVSGPSATSDIELDRVEGVHGPRRLHILVVA